MWLGLLALAPFEEVAAQGSGPVRATLISVEGKVEVRRAGQADWVPASQNDTLEFGDAVRTLAFSRAALELQEGTVQRLDQETILTLTLPQDDKRSWLEVIKGALHIISRDADALRVLTPFANAGIEGTEFLVVVADNETRVTVFEGAVVISNAAGEATASSGQVALARSGQAPLVQAVVRPRDAVQWTLYYAPVLAGALPPADENPTPQQANDPSFLTRRAATRLSVGRADEARADIERALAQSSMNVEALSLQSIIALTQNDKDEALRLADLAVAQDSGSATALISRSYAQQAFFDVSGALASLLSAVERDPRNALAWARLSELWLAVGDLEQGLVAAQRAVDLDPQIARTQTVLGFAYLTRVDIEQATAAFQRAIGLDQSAPMPRLGLGLALIRDGELQRGRAEIELAVILDPGNSLLRSYVGKAYYEEKRDELAESQLKIARELDPLDPTPWLYDAIRKQSINRPVEAMHDLEGSIERNGNRAVYRSTLGLEQDAATRGAGLARIYRDLGFEQLALLEGWKSVYTDQRNYSGHRLLADTYSTLPRHEIARVNELFQSQLLQPLNVTPIQPQLAEANLFILDSAGPTDIAFNEFNPLFNRDRVTFQGSAVGGDNGTQGEDLVLAGIAGRVSYSVGQFHFETDGFRENNDLEQDVVNGFVQYQLSDKTSLLGELRTTERSQGDLRLLFDPQNFDPFRRDTEETDSVRFGARHSFTPESELLASIVYQNADTSADVAAVFSVVADISVYTGEVQHLYKHGRWRFTSGLRFTDLAQDEVATVFGFSTSERVNTDSSGAYVYAQFDAAPTVGITLGASADELNTRFFERDEVNPKLGVIWEPTDRTTVRATAFKTLALLAVSRQNIQPSLEPTQVVGFNQFYSGADAESVERYGLSAEQKISNDLFAGIIVSRRSAAVPFLAQSSAPPFDFFESEASVEEDTAEAYAYWMPTDSLALRVGYQNERFDNDPDFTPLGYVALDTQRLPMELSYFWANGFSASLSATQVDQEGTFAPAPPLFVPTEGADEFWVVDASLRYRLPNRRGLITLNVENLLDETFRYQDTDPENPRILPERFAVLKVTLAF